MDVKTQNLLKKSDINLYSPKWVLDSVKYNKLIPLTPIYLTYANKHTKNIFKNTLDSYNDDYFVEVTNDTLFEIFNNMENFKDDDEYEACLKKLKIEYPNEKIFH